MSAQEWFPAVLAGHVALCVVCETYTRAPVPARWIPSASGPGTTLYACPEHATDLAPGPTPDDELECEV
ncbi:hypothetical protein JJV70_15020 [Streptomyces sp. JJ66]|uniref:hypothetical protein n=1 Tax=Streptomyces sp. JJ66 TaxID=2803843 RepID=UPI001C595F86|nr:hypothetical protein [Streptomyces sp. JJ66]MBW1603390.1 hypothetical protein [Streptomyces sp. JJ66]